MANRRLALFLNNTLGRNSPVNSIITVERTVSAGTVKPASIPAKIVLSNSLAISIPYITSTMLFPTSIVLTKPLGCL